MSTRSSSRRWHERICRAHRRWRRRPAQGAVGCLCRQRQSVRQLGFPDRAGAVRKRRAGHRLAALADRHRWTGRDDCGRCAALCQDPQPGRICVRPWLGRCLGTGGRPILSENTDRRPLLPRARPPIATARFDAGAGADRGNRDFGRAQRPVIGACDLRRSRPDRPVRGGRLADSRGQPVSLA